MEGRRRSALNSYLKTSAKERVRDVPSKVKNLRNSFYFAF